jgi:hypothetical protein
MRCCNDLELLDYFSFDYLVNYALGIRTLGELNLAERTLYYFRERLYLYCLENPDQEDLLFNQFIGLLHVFAEKAGISMDEQRTDTTLFMSNIKKSGRIYLAYDVLVKAVKAIPEEMRTEALAKSLEPGFKTDVLYYSKAQDGDTKLEMLLNLCDEALKILEAQPGVKESGEVRILKRFLDEQSEIDTESGKRTPKSKEKIPSGSLQSAYDEDATYRKKGNVSQSGYVLELSETCGKENDVQFLTDFVVEPNNTSDVDILPGRLETIKENTGCADMYVDGGFPSDDLREAAKKNEIEIHQTNMCGSEPTKKLPVTEFDIDESTNTILKCPGGHVPTSTSVSKSQTSAHFPHEACANCEFREQCYSKEQVKDNVVRINIKTVTVSREREDMKANKKENTSRRAGIEGANSALKRKGLRKLDVRGDVKVTYVAGLKVTVQNVKRFIKYMQGGYKQKTKNLLINGIPIPICS